MTDKGGYFLILGFFLGCLFTCSGGYESSAALAQVVINAVNVSFDNSPSGLAATEVQSAIVEVRANQEFALAQQGAEAMATTTSTISGAVNELVGRITALEARIMTLQTKTAPMSVSGNKLFFTGVNVHVRNGSGDTYTANSLGNVIVGYNENALSRAGSHNLVVGKTNSYYRCAGFVVGKNNQLGGDGCSVLGGLTNIAVQKQSSVHGGYFNTANADYAVCSGGEQNTSEYPYGTVSGGYQIYSTSSYCHVPALGYTP